MHSKKNPWCCLRVFCIFGYREFYKNLLCFLMELNKTIHGNNEDVSDKLWTFSFWVVQESEIIWIGKWEPLFLCSHSLIESSLTNRNSSSTIVWPDWFNVPWPQCLQCQPFMTNLKLDGIESILMITSKITSKLMKWVMWYSKRKIYNTTTGWTGSHSIDDNEEY